MNLMMLLVMMYDDDFILCKTYCLTPEHPPPRATEL